MANATIVDAPVPEKPITPKVKQDNTNIRQGFAFRGGQKPDGDSANTSIKDTSGKKQQGSNVEANASKEASTQKQTTIEATLEMNPHATNFGVKAGKNVAIVGVGNSFSGNYWVKTVRRTLSSSGLSIDLELTRSGFGKDVVEGSVVKETPKPQVQSGTTVQPKEKGKVYQGFYFRGES